jgi:type I restriction enzyme S subunit
MREEWQTTRLGEVLEKTETVNPLDSPNTEFDYIDVSSISNATFEITSTQFIKGKDAPSRARKLVRANDVLFATIRPTLRRIAVVPEKLDGQVCSTGYLVLRPKQGISHRFIFYWLFTENFLRQMERLQRGASYPAVTDGDVKLQEISFPPLLEQQRIVALLDEAFAGLATAKANAERNLQNARAIFESHLQSVFSERGEGWVELRLEEVANENCSLSYGIVQPGEEYGNGIPVVRPTDLTKKVIYLAGLKRIDPKLADGYKRTSLRGGELLLCVRGSTGVVSIAAPELVGANVTRGIVPIRFDISLLLPEFGYYLMRSDPVQRQIREKTYGAALMQINIRDLRVVLLPIPPLNEQPGIAFKLDQLYAETQHLTRNYERKLAALEELKKSLLHQAFNGEL